MFVPKRFATFASQVNQAATFSIKGRAVVAD
jgi:hypothetical protein